MMVSLVICSGLSMLLTGCDSSGQAWRQPDEKDTIQTQQVGCDTVEMAKSMQYYPISSKTPSAVILEKTAPKMIKADAPFNYYLKVTNLTDRTITNVIVSDKIPASMTFVESVTEMERVSEDQVQWKIPVIEPLASALIETTAIANAGGFIMSCAEVFYDCPVCTEIQIVQTELSLYKEAPKVTLSCERIELKYLVSNNGMMAACDIKIKEILPKGLLTAEGKDSFEFTLESLAPGEIHEFTKLVDASMTGNYISKAVLSSSSIKSLESNSTETSVIEPLLTLEESNPENTSIGTGKIFEYVLSNDGQATANNAIIMAMLPNGVELANASGNGKILESDERLIAWRIGDLKPNTSRKVTMTVSSQGYMLVNPQVVAKANCSQTVAAIRLPRLVELDELTSVSLYKPFKLE